MYRKILLPMDLGDEHGEVFDAAIPLLAPEGGALVILHVIEAISGLSPQESEEFYAPLRERAQEHFAEWSKELGKRGMTARCESRVGKRGPTVVRYAIEEECDLIVVTSRAADPERPGWGFGTTSHQVALMAPCSVLLVR